MSTWARVRLAAGLVLALLIRLCGIGAAQPASQTIVIKELTVEGNRRVQEAVILGRVKSTVGGPFNPSQLSEDVRNVFSLGFFDDVQVKVDDFEGGVKVTFVVIERPFVRDIDFVGNKHANATELAEKIDLKLGSVYNPVEVERAREKMKDYYEEEGYFEVQITPDVEKFADGDVRVVFNINEGRRITIERIVFKGNKGLTDRQLKAVMATKERQYYILRGTVQRQRLDEDIERILNVYNDHGYVQARVESHDISIDRQKARATLTFNIVEGPQFRVADVSVSGVTLFPEQEVRRQIKLKPGDVFSRAKLRDSVRAIEELYGTIGRSSADIAPRTETLPSNRMNVSLDITEGPEVYVERINISGNTRSQDKILRREMQMAEGDLFTLGKLQRSRQRLVNLNYFDKVDVTTQPGSDKSKVIINVDVTEKPTGVFSIGGGYSSAENLIGTVDLSQNNFLGRGWQASIRLRAGARSQAGIISFTEPWLFDRPLSAGFDLFDTKRQFLEYNQESLGGGLRTSAPFAEFWRWSLGYRLENDRISHLRVDLGSLTDQLGSRLTSLITSGLTRDSRDNIISPSRGGSTNLLFDFAGIGGDSKFMKGLANTSYFQPVWFSHILSGRLEAAYGFNWAHGSLPLFERFYLGGPNSLRGWKPRHVSPLDSAGVRTGGTTELLGNAEYIIPLPFNIRLAVFYDVGNVYGFSKKFDPLDLRYDAGGGFRWLSPFGPIRVDYGIKLNPEPGEKLGQLNFSVGSPF